MPPDPSGLCVVEVGTHLGPYYRWGDDGKVFCSRHRGQMDEYHAGEYPDADPIPWVPYREGRLGT